MRIRERWLPGPGYQLRRTTGGVMEIRASDEHGLARGLGFAHAHDRMVQMMLLRIIAQGRVSEHLQNDDETTGIDTFMRQVGFWRGAEQEAQQCDEQARRFAQAYCEGVNTYLNDHRRAPELALVGYRPEPWSLTDILATLRIMSYVGLAQSQTDLEKFIVQSLAHGVDLAKMKKLFAPHLDGADESLVELLKKVKIHDGLLPSYVRFASVIPKLVASNNWAIAASRSTSGHALQCNDPHLECNRLPAIWYEWIGRTDDDYRAGITMPGMPGMVMGRTKRLSAGFTYGFMDMIDYFVEEVVNEKVRRGDEFVPLTRTKETVVRRGDSPIELEIRETSHGILETDPLRRIDDGFYLARAWSGQRTGAVRSLGAMLKLWESTNVDEACVAIRDVAISCNWLIADNQGRIAYQQSGLLPRRKHSGLFPLRGWDAANAWDGIADPADLACTIDPPSGILVTANNDMNQDGKPLSINSPQPEYRASRITQLLEAKQKLGLEDMKAAQTDLYSLQAERFMQLFRPLLPDTKAAKVLAAWDLRYDKDSRGAVLFERVYEALFRETFGLRMFGLQAWDTLNRNTPMIADYFAAFDNALLGEDESWWAPEGRTEVVRRVLEMALARPAEQAWGEQTTMMMTNIFFAGKTPRWLGVDYGPVAVQGGRATPWQGSLFQSGGRTTGFMPSFRFITDLGTDEVWTVLSGGPSGNRLSPHYISDVKLWLTGGYKHLRLE